jgi:hypothetical protein
MSGGEEDPLQQDWTNDDGDEGGLDDCFDDDAEDDDGYGEEEQDMLGGEELLENGEADIETSNDGDELLDNDNANIENCNGNDNGGDNNGKVENGDEAEIGDAIHGEDQVVNKLPIKVEMADEEYFDDGTPDDVPGANSDHQGVQLASKECESCSRVFESYTNMLRHIQLSRKCRKHYGEIRIWEMRNEFSANKIDSQQQAQQAELGEEDAEGDELSNIGIVKEEMIIDDGGEEETLDESQSCDSCFKEFQSFGSLMKHIQLSETCREFYGDETLSDMKDSVKPAKSKRGQKRRQKQSSGQQKECCESCSKAFRRYCDLMKHIKLAKACREFYGEKRLLEMRDNLGSSRQYKEEQASGDESEASISESSLFKCRVCFRGFPANANLLKHIGAVPKCKRGYGEEFLHMKKEAVRARYRARDAKRTAAARAQRNGYQSDEYEDEGSNWSGAEDAGAEEDGAEEEGAAYMCKICDKSFSSHPGLMKHVAHTASCKDAYGEEEWEEMKRAAVRFRQQSAPNERKEIARMKRIEHYKANRVTRLEKQKEYYQKNRDKVLSKKRKGYKADVVAKEGRYCLNKLAAITDPTVPHGNLEVDFLTKEGDHMSCLATVRALSSNLECSKLDHVGGDGSSLVTVDEGVALTARTVTQDELPFAETFVALTLSNDGQSIEVRQIMHKDNITLEGIIELFHYSAAVTGVTVKDLVSEHCSPVALIPSSKMPTLRNAYSKEVIANEYQLPDPPKLLCLSDTTSREEDFLSSEMADLIPYGQLLINADLSMRDTAAIGVLCRDSERDSKVALIMVVFAVNMTDWTFYTRHFYSILVNWVGSKSTLTEVVRRTSCGITAQQQLEQDVRAQCLQNALGPKKVEVCTYCGERFEFNKYIFSENKVYTHHMRLHKKGRTCKFCGLEFESHTLKKWHQRTHNTHFLCPKEGCKFVGTEQKTVDTHVRFSHVAVVCDLCGKEYTSVNTLYAHRSAVHEPRKNDHPCEICGRPFNSASELRKHIRRHNKDNSLINKWMKDDPREYKYVCSAHDNCKKYFKTAQLLRMHMRRFMNKDYPDNCARGFRPEIDTPPENPPEVDMFPLGTKANKKEKGEKKKRTRKKKEAAEQPITEYEPKTEEPDDQSARGASPDCPEPGYVPNMSGLTYPPFVNHSYVPR